VFNISKSDRMSQSMSERERARRLRRVRSRRKLRWDVLEDRTLLSSIDFQNLGTELASNLSTIQTGVDSAFQSAAAIPVIGQQIQNSTAITNALSQFDSMATKLEALGTQQNLTDSQLISLVQNTLFPVVGPAGTNWLLDINDQNQGTVEANDIVVTPNVNSDGAFSVELLLSVATTTTVNFNLGLPSFLALSSTGMVDVSLAADYLLEFTFDPIAGPEGSLSLDNTNLQDQATALNNANLPPTPLAFTLSATPHSSTIGSGQLLGLLDASVTDNGTQLTGTFGIAINDGNISVDFSGEAKIGLNLSLSFGGGDVPLDPTITTGVSFDWTFSNTAIDNSDPSQYGSIPDIQFSGVQLQVQLGGIINTILTDIQDFTEPLQPIVNILDEQVPGLSSLGINVTFLNLLLDLTGEGGDAGDINSFLQTITTINKLHIPANGEITLNLINGFQTTDPRQGETSVVGTPDLPDPSSIDDQVNQALGGDLSGVENLGSDSSGGSSGSGSGTGSSTQYGFQFPMFDNPVATIIPLLLGQSANPDLFSFTLPPVNIPAANIQIPIGAVPPFIPEIFLQIGLSLGFDFSAGYDTAGLRELISDESAANGQLAPADVATDLLHGFYVDTKNTYIDMSGSIDLGADAYVVAVAGGVTATVGLTPRPDGNATDASENKTRLDFLIDSIQAGGIFGAFVPTGSIGLNFEINVGLEIGLVNITLFSYSIGPIPILSFTEPSTPPAPSTAPTIYINETNTSEQIHVHQTTYPDPSNSSLVDSAIEVDYPSYTELYPTGQFSTTSAGALVPVAHNPFPQYTQIVTTASGAITAPQTIIVDKVTSYDANDNPTPIDVVLIGGSGNNDLEDYAVGHALLIGGGGANNTLVVNNPAASAIEYGSTIDPDVPSPATTNVPAWIAALPASVTAEIAAEVAPLPGGTSSNDNLTAPGGGDFLEGGGGTNNFSESGDDFTIHGEGQVNNTFQVTQASGQPTSGSAVIYAGSGAKVVNVLILNRTAAQDSLDIQAESSSAGEYLQATGDETNLAVYGVVQTLAVNLDGGTLELGDLNALSQLSSVFVTDNPGSAPNTITLDKPANGAANAITIGASTEVVNAAQAGSSTPEGSTTFTTFQNTPITAETFFSGLSSSDVIEIPFDGGTAQVNDLDQLGLETIKLDGTVRSGGATAPANAITIQAGFGDDLTMTNDGDGGANFQDGTGGVAIDVVGSLSQDVTDLYLVNAGTAAQTSNGNILNIDASALAGLFQIFGNQAITDPSLLPLNLQVTITAVGPGLKTQIFGGPGGSTFDIVHGGLNSSILLVGGTGIGGNALILDRTLSTTAAPDSLELAPTTGPDGAALGVTGTGTSLTVYNVYNLAANIYGGTFDFQDLSSLGAFTIAVTGMASPAGDPNHVIVEAPAGGRPDGNVIGGFLNKLNQPVGMSLQDTPTDTNYSIFGLVAQDDVRIKLNGGGTTTLGSALFYGFTGASGNIATSGTTTALGALGPYTIELDGRTRANLLHPAGNTITIPAPYDALVNVITEPPDSTVDSNYPVIPTGFSATMVTDPDGEPAFETGGGTLEIDGSLPQDQTIVTFPFQVFEGQTPPENILNLDASALEGSLQVDVVTPAEAGFATLPDNFWSFSNTYVTIDGVNPLLNVTVDGLDIQDIPYPYSAYFNPYLGEAFVTFGDGLLSQIQGNVTINNAQLTVDNADSTSGDILTMTSTTLTGWSFPQGIAQPTLTFSPILYNNLVIQAGAGDSFDLEDTPQLMDIFGEGGGTMTIENGATTAPPDSVYVMGTDPNFSVFLQVTGDYSLDVGDRLNPDGSVSDVGMVDAIYSNMTLDYTGTGGPASIVFDASNDTYRQVTDVYNQGPTSLPGYTALTGVFPLTFPYGGSVINFNLSNIDVTFDSTQVPIQSQPNDFFLSDPGTDLFTYNATAIPGDAQPDNQLSVNAVGAPLHINGNGNTLVTLGGDTSDGFDDIASDVYVNDAALNVDAAAFGSGTPNLSDVVLTGGTLTGATTGTLHFSDLESLSLEVPSAGAAITVDDTPAGATTTLSLYNTTLAVLGTTGPLDASGEQGYGQLFNSTVTIGDGTLSDIQGDVNLEGDGLGDGGLIVKLEDQDDVAHSGVLMSPTSLGVDTIAGIAPAEIGFNGGGTEEIDGSAGSTYDVTGNYSPVSLFAGAGSVVGLNPTEQTSITSLTVLGAATVNANFTGTLSGVTVETDPARPTDMTDLVVNATEEIYSEFTLGDGPTGFESIYSGALDYQGNTVSLTATLGDYNYSGVALVVDDTGTAGTTINQDDRPAIIAGTTGPLVLDSTNPDWIQIGNNGSVQAILGQVEILDSSSTSTNSLLVDDSADTTARSATLAPVSGSPGVDALTGPAPAPIEFTAARFDLTANGGTGGNTFQVIDTANGAPIILNAGSGTNVIQAMVSGSGGYAPLTVNGGAGSNTLGVGGDGDDPLVTNDPNTGQPGSGTISASYPPSGPTRTITYSEIGNIVGATSVSLASSSSSGTSDLGQAVTFTASVAPDAQGLGTPSGTVTFYDGSTSIGAEPLIGGTASLTTSVLALGSHTITASYAPSDDFLGSRSLPLQQTIVTALAINSIGAVSPNPRNTAVSTIGVSLNELATAGGFTNQALTLTDNGGPNLITGAVTVTPITATAYAITGLGALTTAEGNYTLTINAAEITDPYGNAGTGSMSTSWLMDTTPPTSTVNPLPQTTTSTSFTVSVSGDDPNGANGSPPSGIASIAIDVSTNGGSYTTFATVTPANPSASFTGQVGNTYGFYSVATDNAGNVQPTPTSAQATIQIVSPLSLISIAPVSSPTNKAVATIDVTFSEPINTASLTSGALTLTDDGGPDLTNGGVTLTLVSGDTYAIGGLAGLTAAEGGYTLTINGADLQDQHGIAGTGTLSTSWLMDTMAPSSHVVNALGTSQSSDSFPVQVAFTDLAGPGGAPASGVSSVALYVSVNNGPFAWYQTQTIAPAASGTLSFTFDGKDRNIYAFHSIAEDAAGNVESKSGDAIEASTSVPDLHPPVTQVLATSSYNNNGVFTINWSGTDPDQDTGTPAGSIALVNLYVVIDGETPTLIGQLNGGTPNGSGVYSGSMTYDALGDGQSHSYGFYSVGIDDEQKVQATPSAPNMTFSDIAYTSPLAVENLMVEKGIAERSFIEYLDVDFNQTVSSNAELQALQTGLAGGSGGSYMQLLWFGEGLNGTSKPEGSVNLFSIPGEVTLSGNDLSINFGANGITRLLTEYNASGTGSPISTFGDGWYALGINPTGGATSGPVFFETFYRLLGDTNGDGVVTGPFTTAGTDAYVVYHAEGETGPLLDADVNGDGAVNSKDLTETVLAAGHAVGTTPPQEANFPQFQLFAGATAAPGHVVAITRAEVRSLLPAAIAAWQAAGLGAAEVRALEQVPVGVANLGSSTLGEESGGAITINQTAVGYDWYVPASSQAFGLTGPGGESVAGAGSPAANDVDLLTVLEHELGHVLGLPDNAEAGDLMDITLGLGVRRAPSASDLAAVAGTSSTAVPNAPTAVVPTGEQSTILLIGSVSGATVDAALASIGGTAIKPDASAGSMGPPPGPGVAPSKRDRSAQLSRPYPHRVAASMFPRKIRSLGQSSAPGRKS
jgi:hypothetical protein